MRATRLWIAAVAFSLAASTALPPVGIAGADCTTAGDYGAGSGCAPPGSSSGSDKTESWPPTSVDWPPQLDSETATDGGKDDAKPTPIVMPSGQKPPPSTPTPIVPVGPPAAATPTTSTTPTPIVSPHS
jgi:hypothetical protein